MMTIETGAGGQEALWVEQAHLQARQSLLSTLSSSLRGRHSGKTTTVAAVSPSVVLLQQQQNATKAAATGTENDATTCEHLDNDPERSPSAEDQHQPPPDHLFVRVLAARKLLVEGKTAAAFQQALTVRQAMEATPILLNDTVSTRRQSDDAAAALTHILNDAVAKGHAAMERGQYERAQDLLDFILPPATTVVQPQAPPDPHHTVHPQHSDGVSSLGFMEDDDDDDVAATRTTMSRQERRRLPPLHRDKQPSTKSHNQTPLDRTRDAPRNNPNEGTTKKILPTSNGAADVMSMSSLNEILDGPLSPSPRYGRFSLLRGFHKKSAALDSDHHHRPAVTTALLEDNDEPCTFMATIVVGEEQQACWDTSVEVSVAGGLVQTTEAETRSQNEKDDGDDTMGQDEPASEVAPRAVENEEEMEPTENVAAEMEEANEDHEGPGAPGDATEDCSLPSATVSSVSNSSSASRSSTREETEAPSSRINPPVRIPPSTSKRLSPLRRMFSRRSSKKKHVVDLQNERDFKLEDLLDDELLASVNAKTTSRSNNAPVSPSSVSSSNKGDRYAIAEGRQENTGSLNDNDKYSIPSYPQHHLSCPPMCYGCDSCLWQETTTRADFTVGDEDDDDGVQQPASLTKPMSYSQTVHDDADKYGSAADGNCHEDAKTMSTSELGDGDSISEEHLPAQQSRSKKRFALFRRQAQSMNGTSTSATENTVPSSPPPKNRQPLRGILKSTSLGASNEVHAQQNQQRKDELLPVQYEPKATTAVAANDSVQYSPQSKPDNENENAHIDPLLDRLRRRGLEPSEPQAPRLDP